jgi:hypothetical protein
MALERFVSNKAPLRAQSSAVRVARGQRGYCYRCAGGMCSSEIAPWRGIMRSGVGWVREYVCTSLHVAFGAVSFNFYSPCPPLFEILGAHMVVAVLLT